MSSTVYYIYFIHVNTLRLWKQATHYINTIIGTDQMTWTSFKWIILGFHNAPIAKNLISALEDIRLAFFRTIWYTRNQAMWYNNYPTSTKILHNTLTEYIKLRQTQARKQNTMDTFKNSYGRMFTADKLHAVQANSPQNPIHPTQTLPPKLALPNLQAPHC